MNTDFCHRVTEDTEVVLAQAGWQRHGPMDRLAPGPPFVYEEDGGAAAPPYRKRGAGRGARGRQGQLGVHGEPLHDSPSNDSPSPCPLPLGEGELLADGLAFYKEVSPNGLSFADGPTAFFLLTGRDGIKQYEIERQP